MPPRAIYSFISKYKNTEELTLNFLDRSQAIQSFFRLYAVTVTVPLPHRYRFGPNVTQRY